MPDSSAQFQSTASQNTALGHMAELENYKVFAVTGADAATFLHGQLTNDVTALGTDDARYAGYCTAKGRLLATLLVWRAAADEPSMQTAASTQHADIAIFGIMRRSLFDAIIKRLSMFVLRAKVKFSAPEINVAGVWVDATALDALSVAAGGTLPSTPWQRVDLASGTWIAAPHPGATLRWWWIATSAQRASATTNLANLLCQADASLWQADELAEGLPWIDASTQDLFIPQTVNLDLIDGVNFTKGCYPGQEIVARSHYLGTVKRRMAFGTVSVADVRAASLPGTDIYQSSRADEPCGRIIDAARTQIIDAQHAPETSAAGDLSVLFETTLSAMAAADLRLGAADGPSITLRALPYALA